MHFSKDNLYNNAANVVEVNAKTNEKTGDIWNNLITKNLK